MDNLLSFDISPFSWSAIGSSLICGTIIGFERQIRGKPAGIRTSTLIILGTYIFIACAQYVSIDASMSDPSRIIGQVITGIGFLGAGVMLSKGRSVYGVTSAATIWALAAIGVCIAVGRHEVAIKLSAIIVVILFGVDLLEDYSQRFSNRVHRKYSVWRNRDNE